MSTRRHVPDYAEPIEGWRIWVVVPHGGGVALRSVFFDDVWLPDEPLVATCAARERRLLALRPRQAPHAAPDARCLCGIHAATTLDEVVTYLERDVTPALCWAVGRVALWGSVVECTNGWRGSRAYPRSLVVPTRQGPARHAPETLCRRVAADLAVYRVSVGVLDGDVRTLDSPAAA